VISAPYSTPPVANRLAILAMQPRLLAWPPPHLAERSSLWFCGLPHDNIQVDHTGFAALAAPAQNKASLVDEYSRFLSAILSNVLAPA
jgi:hypothetical protein